MPILLLYTAPVMCVKNIIFATICMYKMTCREKHSAATYCHAASLFRTPNNAGNPVKQRTDPLFIR